jgi:class 3 adenylate cyclase
MKETAKILVVDDDPDVLVAARFVLKKHFTHVETASRPNEISHLLAHTRYNAALIDMNYSAGLTDGREGFELLHTIKRHAPATHVVMMTAYGDIDLAIKAIKEGAADFIVKPWDNAKLISTTLGALKKGLSEANSPLPTEQPAAAQHHQAFAEVERIFMFLDIRSSTSIAERLGHLRYFGLLNDFFRDIAGPIENSRGQIYQYVGDEVVVNWTPENGLNNANCIACFFGIEEVMERLAGQYEQKYGLVPTFKAGMHMGKVSTGTVGTLKKEVIYTGDVLNTTSRIEGLCNKYNVRLLLSQNLADRLPADRRYATKSIGAIGLRGKSSEMHLMTVERAPRYIDE